MQILEKIREAGVVGCGGAGFPTHIKLKTDGTYFLINGAECEPLLRTDRTIMTRFAPQLIEAIDAIGRERAFPHCVIALKETYREEIAALEAAIREAGSSVRLHTMKSFYPAGDEQSLVYEVTGRVVPPGALPSAVGCVVDNAATVLAVYDAMQGRPMTHKFLTVTGAVRRPTVLRVPIGTSFARCIELAGGAAEKEFHCVSGGPMMGRSADVTADVVTKTTSGILILPAEGYHARHDRLTPDVMLRRAASACIQCQSCTELCPRNLLGHPIAPHKIMRKLAMDRDISALLNDPDIQHAQFCCECGICETVACPMGLQPRTINRLVKAELGKAQIRAVGGEGPFTPSPERDVRKIPTAKAAARLGLGAYYHLEIRGLREEETDRVDIPLRMHIGAPSLPVVKAGDRVALGQLIAVCPPDALGAAIHASIAGIVTAVGERITIEREAQA